MDYKKKCGYDGGSHTIFLQIFRYPLGTYPLGVIPLSKGCRLFLYNKKLCHL